MSERTVSLKTKRFQQPYGDTYLRAEVDFHMDASQFGGCPGHEAAIAVVKALWPTATNVDLTATPHANATERRSERGGREYADRWIVRGIVGYAG